MIWGACLGLSLWGAYLWRPLWNDGAFWAYQVITGEAYWIDKVFSRYLTLIPQTPVLLYVKLFSEFNLNTAVSLFSLGYALISWAWFTLGNIYLARKNRWDLLAINILIYLGIVMGTQGYYVSIALETASLGVFLFWFFLLEEDGALLWFILIVGTFLLFFGYELVVLYYIFFGLMFLYRKKWRVSVFFLLAILIYGVFLFFNLTAKSSAHVGKMLEQSLNNDFIYYNYAAYITFAFFLCLFMPNGKLKKTMLGIEFLLLIACFFMDSKLLHLKFMTSYMARVLLIPSTVGIMFFIFLVHVKNWKLNFSTVAVLLLALYILSFHQEYRFNSDWTVGKNRIMEISEESGCHYLDRKTLYGKELNEHAYVDWVLPYMSLFYRGEKKTERILFTQRLDSKTPYNPCLENNGEKFDYPGNFIITIISRNNLELLERAWRPARRNEE